jgi:hypothetical protein
MTSFTLRNLEEILDFLKHRRCWAVNFVHMQEKSSTVLVWCWRKRVAEWANIENIARIPD